MLESEVLQQLHKCISVGISGTENYQDVCGVTQVIQCDSLMEQYCFVNNLTKVLDVIFDLIYPDGVDTTRFPDHYNCVNTFEKYENIILPGYIHFLDLITTIANLSSLLEAQTLFLNFESIINTTLGTYFLKTDPTIGWAIPPNNEQLETVCNWYIKGFDTDNSEFGRTLNKFKVYLFEYHNTLTEKFFQVVKGLGLIKDMYNRDISGPIALFKVYLHKKITKQNLSEAITDTSFTQSIASITMMTDKIKEATSNFAASCKQFYETYTEFYETLSVRTWPFVTSTSIENYQFLNQMMEWYETYDGKELLHQYLGVTGNLNGQTFRSDTDFTALNIWRATKNAVMGFDKATLTRTGFNAYIIEITDNIINKANKLQKQLESMALTLQVYQQKLIMDVDFYT